MLHPSTKKLIDRLAAMTAQKKIDWIEKDNGDVMYATEGYVVRLTPEPPRVLLSTENGKPLEDASSNVLAATAREDGGTYGDLVTTLARDACRDARGTEDAISTLLAGLSDTPAETADDTPEAAFEEETVAEVEDDAADAAVEADEDTLEDPVDDTTVLSAAAPDPVESEVESTWPAGAGSAGTTSSGWDDDQPDEDLVDASVPEAAILDAAETDDEVSAASSEEDLAGNDIAETDDEDDVGGAVARLADEVNAGPADPADGDTVSAPDTSDEAPQERHQGLAADDAARMEDAGEAGDTDTSADDGSPSDEAEGVEAGSALTPSFSVQPDDAPILGEAPEDTAPEAAAPVAEAESVEEPPVEDTLSDASEIPSETHGAGEPSDDTLTTAEADAFPQQAPDEDVTIAAPVGGAGENEPQTAEAAELSGAETMDTDSVAEAGTEPVPEPQAAATNVHYIPFGAGGIEAEGADVSAHETEESAHDADAETDASLAGAATMMSAPQADTGTEAAANVQDDTHEPEGDAGDETAPSTLQANPASSDTAPAAPGEPVAAPQAVSEPVASPEPDQPGPISLSGMAAGHGFGRTATGFQPTAPSPSPAPRDDEHVGRAPVFIDATDDYSGDSGTAAESANMPDVSGLDSRQDFVETSVSNEDLDAVAPQEAQTSAQTPEAETALSLVETDTSGESPEPVEDEPRAARPKTRFNPWT